MTNLESLQSSLLLGVAERDERLERWKAEGEGVAAVGFDIVNNARESLSKPEDTVSFSFMKQ